MIDLGNNNKAASQKVPNTVKAYTSIKSLVGVMYGII